MTIKKHHPDDLKPTGDGYYYIDTGYGRLVRVNVVTADYICRLRQVIRAAGLSENTRHNADAAK